MKLYYLSHVILPLCLLLSSTKAEHRVKKDINLIKEIILTKIFGTQNENKSRPIFVQENTYRNPEGLLAVGKEEITIKIPKESEEPFKPEYSYKQIRNDGTAILYTLNDKDEVIVTDTRVQQPTDSSESIRSRPDFSSYSSFQARLKPSKPCHSESQPIAAYSPIRPIVYPVPQIAKIPEYSYKVIHKDGSVTTYFGTGEVQEQQLRDPGISVNRFVQNPPYYINRIQNAAIASPYVAPRRNIVVREEVPIELFETDQNLPSYALPRNEVNFLQNDLLYLQQPAYNNPVPVKPNLKVDYEQIDADQTRNNIHSFFASTKKQQSSGSSEKSSETVESISELLNRLTESKINLDIQNDTKHSTSFKSPTAPSVIKTSKPRTVSGSTYSYVRNHSEGTTPAIAVENDNIELDNNDDAKVDENNLLGRGRGDIPT